MRKILMWKVIDADGYTIATPFFSKDEANRAKQEEEAKSPYREFFVVECEEELE
jgi:hypothetical protein